MQTASTAPSPEATGRVDVHLLGRFRIVHRSAEVELPHNAQRLVAFLALADRVLERTYLAGCLWLDKSERRAQANLRSSLWRLRQCGVPLVEVTPTVVRLAPTVTVDVSGAVDLGRRLIDEKALVAEHELDGSMLRADLLPEWYDDFVEVERERLRQLRLHALEALARRLLAVGLTASALDAALAAVVAEPLRESAHRSVIAVHLAESNVYEALRQYDILVRLLEEQLGVEPSSAVRALVAPYLGGGLSGRSVPRSTYA